MKKHFYLAAAAIESRAAAGLELPPKALVLPRLLLAKAHSLKRLIIAHLVAYTL